MVTIWCVVGVGGVSSIHSDVLFRRSWSGVGRKRYFVWIVYEHHRFRCDLSVQAESRWDWSCGIGKVLDSLLIKLKCE